MTGDTIEEIIWGEVMKDVVDEFGKRIDRIITEYGLDDEEMWELVMERLRDFWVP